MYKFSVAGTKAVMGMAVLASVVSVSSHANATAFAYSALEILNLNSNIGSKGPPATQMGGFDSFFFTSPGLSANLTGFGSANRPASTANCTVGGCSTDLQRLNLGTAVGSENSFFNAKRPSLGSPGTAFAIADSHQLDTTLDGIDNPRNPGTTTNIAGQITSFGTPHATGFGNMGAMTGAFASGNGAGLGEATSGNSLSWTFTLSAADIRRGGDDLTVSFDYLSNLVAQTLNDGDFAHAGLNLTVSFSGGGINDNFTLIGENFNASTPSTLVGSGQSGDPDTVANRSFNHTWENLIASTPYVFSITYGSSASVTSVAVPEPGTLGLLGLGLIGLGASFRRRKAA